MSNFYSPEPEPGHFANLGLKARHTALNEYNYKLAELRANGIKDHLGHRNMQAEQATRSILTRALNQLSRTDELKVVQHIVLETNKDLERLNARVNATKQVCK